MPHPVQTHTLTSPTKPFTSCCIGSAGHRTTTTTTSPTLPAPSTLPSPEFAFPTHAPSFTRSQSFPASYAGARWGSMRDAPVHTIPAGLQDTEWGTPTSLDGLLGTALICHEALQPAHTKALYSAGMLLLNVDGHVLHFRHLSDALLQGDLQKVQKCR